MENSFGKNKCQVTISSWDWKKIRYLSLKVVILTVAKIYGTICDSKAKSVKENAVTNEGCSKSALYTLCPLFQHLI